ncbi:hypothetical protein YTPLAS21_01820 [Candidatus Nitrosocosmicus sp.]|jgi:hypothetical protein|uniref:hypothetical protein n=1 Tax=Candidatus Nitrosocosmicus sp. FF01 TaxID=3397670 RepID=UPI002ACCADF6|nr:hypothetical protein YTPLAS21_01820 [Candidatus Nitrosocosmicus sp.]
MNVDKYFFFIMSFLISGILIGTNISIIATYAQEQGTINSLSSNIVNLELREIEIGESPTGLIYVKGTAINNSTLDTRDVKVLVKLFDANNSTVSETSRFITPASSTFKPGYERDFYFFVSANNVDHYIITAEGEKVP